MGRIDTATPWINPRQADFVCHRPRSRHPARILQQRLQDATLGRYELPSASFDDGGASVGVVAVDPSRIEPEAALQLADAEMYRVKQAREAVR